MQKYTKKYTFVLIHELSNDLLAHASFTISKCSISIFKLLLSMLRKNSKKSFVTGLSNIKRSRI